MWECMSEVTDFRAVYLLDSEFETISADKWSEHGPWFISGD